MVIDVWVKDKESGYVHKVGTDQHDSLRLLNGKVEYYNLQNGDGTSADGLGGYEFIKSPELDDFYE